MTATIDEHALNRFLDLAIAGKHRGCSGGESAARKLAKAVLDEGVRLDGEALEGFLAFARVAKSRPDAARAAIAYR